MRWSHTALNCADLKATEDFYRTWFGFERARVVGDTEPEVVFLRRDGVYLELFNMTGQVPSAQPAADGPQAPGQLRHIAFQVDDVDAFLEQLGDAAPVTLGPLSFDQEVPGWRTVWLSDPDGVVIEVSQGYRDQNSDELQHAPRG